MIRAGACTRHGGGAASRSAAGMRVNLIERAARHSGGVVPNGQTHPTFKDISFL